MRSRETLPICSLTDLMGFFSWNTHTVFCLRDKWLGNSCKQWDRAIQGKRWVKATRDFKLLYLHVIQLNGGHLLWKLQCSVMLFCMDRTICIMWHTQKNTWKNTPCTTVMPSRYPKVGQIVSGGRCQWLGQWSCALQIVWGSCTPGSAWINLSKKGEKKIGQNKIKKIDSVSS